MDYEYFKDGIGGKYRLIPTYQLYIPITNLHKYVFFQVFFMGTFQ